MEPIVLDVWGGKCSENHVARYYRPLEEALDLARRELLKGFLVNLRPQAGWGPDYEFDQRN